MRGGEAEGPTVGGLSAPVFCADAGFVSRVTKTSSPTKGRAAEKASTSDRAGTGGIQISLPDIDIVMAVRVRT